MSTPYNQRFYDEQVQGSRLSAEQILPRLFEVYQARSVVDVGCGRGTWLTVAGRLGAVELHGFDGDWVNQSDLVSDAIVFHRVNLEELLPLKRRYDLCICVEVAEHLANTRADGLIDDLCAASDVVLFGGAIPEQGGVGHVNERWPSYWIERFQARGYTCHDVFRGWAWNKVDVEWWYRQNAFLFVSHQPRGAVPTASQLRAMEQPVYDAVHPELFKAKVAALLSQERQLRAPSLRTIGKATIRYARDRIRRVLGILHQKAN